MSNTSRLTLGQYARAIAWARARVSRYIDSSLFGDPCFDMLLDLYASAEQGQTVYVTSSAVASRVPLTSALRYMAAMEREGLIERRPDPTDARRRLVSMNEETRIAMSRYLSDIAAALEARPVAAGSDDGHEGVPAGSSAIGGATDTDNVAAAS